jgi:hypothetical protein
VSVAEGPNLVAIDHDDAQELVGADHRDGEDGSIRIDEGGSVALLRIGEDVVIVHRLRVERRPAGIALHAGCDRMRPKYSRSSGRHCDDGEAQVFPVVAEYHTLSAEHRRTAFSISVSNTGWRSKSSGRSP